MEESGIKVYIKINENNEIIEINSEIFISSLSGWILIDEGFGDKYALAQSNYLNDDLIDINGNYNFILVNGKIQRKGGK